MCTEDEVFEMLSTFDTAKSSGHDEISARMLIETALSMTPAVTKLFNMLISLGALPEGWKLPEYPLFPSHLPARTPQTLPDFITLCICTQQSIGDTHEGHHTRSSVTVCPDICSTVGFLS